jgi:hypothetical protein
MLIDDQMSRRLHIGGALLATIVAVATAAPPARGACGGVETARPVKKVNPGGHAPLAIGDSTMLLALPNLARAGYQANARGCRTIEEGLDVIRGYKRQGRLPHLVAIALGADATLSSGQMETAFRLIGPRRVLGLVTPIELGGGTSNDADVVRAAAKRHPKRSVLLDWVSFSSGHGEWFQPDGLHLTFAGAAGFAKLLGRAIPFAKPGKFPNGAHYPHS